MTDQTTPEPLTDVPVEHPLSYKLLADLYERAGIQDPNKFDLDHADLQALFDEIDWQRSERNKTRRAAADADAVTAKAKALMGRRTATLKARAERAEAALAEARELARRWQRDAHKHRKIADSRPGLTQIERAEIRQAATEIEQCSRQLVAEIGPDPAERVETTTVADPEPTYIEISTETPEEAAAPGPAPLTLAQAATALHDWASDLADGARADWPAGHPDIIRGIRAAADWLDARDRYETETREQLRALVDRHGMADRTCLIGDDTSTPDVDGWTIYPTTDGGLMVSHDTDADLPTLAADDSIPIAAVLAFIAESAGFEEAPESAEDHPSGCCGTCDAIHADREAREAEPAEPTLRDVMAAAYRAGLGIRRDVDHHSETQHNGERWHLREWSLFNGHRREVGRLEIEIGPRQTYVRLTGRASAVSGSRLLTEPTLRDTLTAAREAGLIGDES